MGVGAFAPFTPAGLRHHVHNMANDKNYNIYKYGIIIKNRKSIKKENQYVQYLFPSCNTLLSDIKSKLKIKL